LMIKPWHQQSLGAIFFGSLLQIAWQEGIHESFLCWELLICYEFGRYHLWSLGDRSLLGLKSCLSGSASLFLVVQVGAFLESAIRLIGLVVSVDATEFHLFIIAVCLVLIFL
jgi:hypothetical protein